MLTLNITNCYNLKNILCKFNKIFWIKINLDYAKKSIRIKNKYLVFFFQTSSQ